MRPAERRAFLAPILRRPWTQRSRSRTTARSRPRAVAVCKVSPLMLPKMFLRAALIVLASVAIGCDQVATLAEPSPTELLQKASANLAKAKTAHIDGGGSFAISPFSFDFKLTGDTEIPDKSRLTMQMSLLGQTLSVDTV